MEKKIIVDWRDSPDGCVDSYAVFAAEDIGDLESMIKTLPRSISLDGRTRERRNLTCTKITDKGVDAASRKSLFHSHVHYRCDSCEKSDEQQCGRCDSHDRWSVFKTLIEAMAEKCGAVLINDPYYYCHI